MANEALEPKVAKLEVAVDTVTKDLASLTGIVRELAQGVQKQWQQTEAQYSQLLVAVERAAAPRKTDWHLVLGAVGLILALGAAAFSPMMLRTNDLQDTVNRMQSSFSAHERLNLHPVGESKISAIEADLKERSQRNTEAIREIDAKLQKEYVLIDAAIRERVMALDKELKDKDEKQEAALRLFRAQVSDEHKVLSDRIHETLPTLQQRVAVLEALISVRSGQSAPAPGIVR